MYFWGAWSRARLGPGQGAPASEPVWAPGCRSRVEDGRDWGRRPGSRGCRGAQGVGGAGHARVNVRPAPAALTQFHQKLEGWRCRNPRAPDTRAETAVRAARDTWTGTSAEPGPTPLTCAGNAGRGEPGGGGAGSGHVWPFVLRRCVSRVRELFSRRPAAGSPKCAWEDRAHLPFLHSRGVRALGLLHFLPAGPPPGDLLADPMSRTPSPPSRRSLAPSEPRGPLCEGDPGGEEGDDPRRKMAGGRLSRPASQRSPGGFCSPPGRRGQAAAGDPSLLTADGCLNRFTPGVPDFVLDTDASVRNGATFRRSSPRAAAGTACTPAAAPTTAIWRWWNSWPRRQETPSSPASSSTASTKQNFVCKFAAQGGFMSTTSRGRFTAPTASCGPRALEVRRVPGSGRLTKDWL